MKKPVELLKCCKDIKNHTVVDYDPIWLDGRVICKKCGSFVRNWDAG